MVPIPTLPLESTIKAVVVAVLVVVEMAKSERVSVDEVAEMESLANGEVVPIARLPLLIERAAKVLVGAVLDE